uniref:Golli protein TP8S.1 n=1 Tax=Xenopus laevis TaxID=8355 RepID=B2ZZ76_XENLA|nr:golli protein TP8S.1 [Xenopus laevis]
MGNTVGKKEHSNDNPTENARDNVEEENTVIQSGEAVQEPDDNDVFAHWRIYSFDECVWITFC